MVSSGSPALPYFLAITPDNIQPTDRSVFLMVPANVTGSFLSMALAALAMNTKSLLVLGNESGLEPSHKRGEPLLI